MSDPDQIMEPKEKEQPKERPLTREERRYQERINREVQEVFDQLTRNFFTFFMSSDPEGIEVQDKIKQLDAQWRVYCKRKKLLAKGYPMLKQYCEKLIEEYKTEKA
jgi:uncharacterized protein YnzC (UPF0291/DUF896 family)